MVTLGVYTYENIPRIIHKARPFIVIKTPADFTHISQGYANHATSSAL